MREVEAFVTQLPYSFSFFTWKKLALSSLPLLISWKGKCWVFIPEYGSIFHLLEVER